MSSQDRSPAFPFFAKDYLSDAKLMGLTWAGQGKYWHLLASMWVYSDSGCYLPRRIAEKLYGKKSVATFVAGKDPLLDVEEWDGEVCLFSHRLLEEAQKLQSRSAAARRSAETGWKKRKAVDDANA